MYSRIMEKSIKLFLVEYIATSFQYYWHCVVRLVGRYLSEMAGAVIEAHDLVFYNNNF